MSVLVFLVLSELSPGISILLLSGVFLCQTPLEIKRAFHPKPLNCNVRNRRQRNQYDIVDGNNRDLKALLPEDPPDPVIIDQPDKFNSAKIKILGRLECIFEHWGTKGLAYFLQLAGLGGLIIFWAYTLAHQPPDRKNYRHLVGLPLVLVAMSVIWSDRFQEEVASSYKKNSSARYKSSELSWNVAK